MRWQAGAYIATRNWSCKLSAAGSAPCPLGLAEQQGRRAQRTRLQQDGVQARHTRGGQVGGQNVVQQHGGGLRANRDTQHTR